MQNPSVDKGRRGAPRYHPGCPRGGGRLIALTGEPAAGWTLCLTGRACPARLAGRQASSASTARRWRREAASWLRPAGLAPSPARWRLAYYSCPGQYSIEGGPSGIRTHDLLNAIETRSQLRYGPLRVYRVDLEGFEPSTSSVRLKRAPNCATGPHASPTILPEARRGVNLRQHGHPPQPASGRCETGGIIVACRVLLRTETRCRVPTAPACRNETVRWVAHTDGSDQRGSVIGAGSRSDTTLQVR